MRVAVTGARGRLGRALGSAIESAPFAPFGPIAWSRPEFDLDDPGGFARLVERDRPDIVVHAAAWTDVDACARDPESANRRNGQATGALADACSSAGVDLIAISTNEVFDGRRSDGRGYGVDDAPNPINPYGASKLLGEELARDAYAASRSARLAIVRTAWLYGPPGNDFPSRILSAAERAVEAGEPLRLVADEVGSPTYSVDLAETIVELIGTGEAEGIRHVVNAGRASRAAWARAVLRGAGIDLPTRDVPASTWTRDSRPPAWAVLEPSALPSGEPLRPWTEALADYLPTLLRTRADVPGARR